MQKRGARAARKAILQGDEDDEFLKELKAEFKKMTGKEGAMAQLDHELYEADPEMEIDFVVLYSSLELYFVSPYFLSDRVVDSISFHLLACYLCSFLRLPRR